jgi:hypothetical protein
MPIVTEELSKDFSKSKYRPNCSDCGKFVGVGGYYDVFYDGYNGGYEEGYHYCRKHYEERCNEKKN